MRAFVSSASTGRSGTDVEATTDLRK